MQYPFRSDSVQSALEHMAYGPYAHDDAPHLRTQRYSLDSSYDTRDVNDKIAIDAQGVQDNLYWHNFTREENRVGR
jgi:hypothetical protein